jgi:hypothetical protein
MSQMAALAFVCVCVCLGAVRKKAASPVTYQLMTRRAAVQSKRMDRAIIVCVRMRLLWRPTF